MCSQHMRDKDTYIVVKILVTNLPTQVATRIDIFVTQYILESHGCNFLLVYSRYYFELLEILTKLEYQKENQHYV